MMAAAIFGCRRHYCFLFLRYAIDAAAEEAFTMPIFIFRRYIAAFFRRMLRDVMMLRGCWLYFSAGSVERCCCCRKRQPAFHFFTAAGADIRESPPAIFFISFISFTPQFRQRLTLAAFQLFFAMPS
jgi:hypothetical protein